MGSRTIIRSGIVFIPGFNGTRLQHTKYNDVAKNMLRRNVKYNMSVYTGMLNNISMKEWFDDFKVMYNEDKQTYESNGNVFIGQIGMYDLDPIRNLSTELETLDLIMKHLNFVPNLISDYTHNKYAFMYYEALIQSAKENGYYEGRSLMAMPYDFRLILEHNVLNEFMERMKYGCEEMMAENCEKHTLVCHSLGGILVYYFLVKYMPKEWVKQHIANVVFVNVPWGGVSILLQYILNGYHYLPQYKKQYRDMITKFSGFTLCLPNNYGYDSDNMILLTQSKSYNSMCIDDLYSDMNDTDSLLAYRHHQPIITNILESIQIPIPETVNVHVLYNTSMDTINSFKYHQLDKDTLSNVFFTKGDGLVSKQSLEAIKVLHNQCENYTFYDFENIPKVLNIGHTNFLEYDPLLDVITGVIHSSSRQ